MADSKIHSATVRDATQVSDEENGNFDRSWRDEKWDGGVNLSEAAGQQAKEQSEMTVFEAVRNYTPGLLWCLVSTGPVEGMSIVC